MFITKLDQYWKDLSVSKKLYAVVGLMVFLITAELTTMKYTVNILSSVRAFVAGEGLWSKAQKNALLEIQNYIIFRDEKYYKSFLEQLAVPLGDRAARMELSKPHPNLQIVYAEFIKARNHPSDVEGMAKLILNFHKISYLERSIDAWTKADLHINEIVQIADDIHSEILKTPKNKPLLRQQELLQKISDLNVKITTLEDQFTYSLGEGSRWVENTLFWTSLIVILIVESTGLFFTYRFSKGLLNSLQELNLAANKIGTGDLSQRAPVNSADELGQLAASLNQMCQSLQDMSGEKHHAEEANQFKSQFLANMSHEIRTPLGAILGFAELLKENNLSEENRQQYLNIITRTGTTLVSIINDILDLSKVEAGKLEISKEVCSLKEITNDMHELLKIRSEKNGIAFEVEQFNEVPEFIYTDPIRLSQILVNITGNAIKYTKEGSVYVRFGIQDNELQFYIKDSGIGLNHHEISKLFLPFSQADQSIRKKYGGTGLGLVLSRRLAELLGGNVNLEKTEIGKGSIFSIKIPYQIPEHLKSTSIKETVTVVQKNGSIENCQILLVEDTIENQILISHILEKYGAKVSVAENGKVAIGLTEQNNFDLILMDMQMPVLDGFSATSLLRKKGYTKPIISLTAHAMQEDLKKCIDSGCNEVLTKPVTQAKLIQTVTKFCA